VGAGSKAADLQGGRTIMIPGEGRETEGVLGLGGRGCRGPKGAWGGRKITRSNEKDKQSTTSSRDGGTNKFGKGKEKILNQTGARGGGKMTVLAAFVPP